MALIFATGALWNFTIAWKGAKPAIGLFDAITTANWI
jgi:hypothetical protein